MFALSDLITPVTKEEVEASIYDVLGIVGTAITSWKPFAVVRTMITGVAILLAGFSVLTADIARSGFLEFATGAWLKLIAKYVYGIDETLFEATFAAGELTLVNSGGGVYTLDPGDLVGSSPTTGKTYRNTTTFTLNASTTLTVPITAVEAGAGSTAAPDTITELETTLLGVTCTNALAIVGRDEMQDAEIRTLCAAKLGALSPFGPSDAYAYAARTAARADGTACGVTRVRTVPGANGTTTTYVATATGTVTGTIGDTSTDLGAIDDSIQRNAAPLCNYATTESASEQVVAITYQAWAYNIPGMTQTQLAAEIAVALATFTSVQPIGGNVIGVDPGAVFLDAIRAAISATRPEIFHVVLTVPTVDVVLDPDEIMVLGTVTCTSITFVQPGDAF